MDARPATDNPLGLNLDFLYGRGFLWAEQEHVTDWVTLEKLRMEIPDLTFPFDVRGGLSRFRDTRCTLRELDLRISEIGVIEALQDIWDGLEGFSDLDVRFLNGVILFATRVRTFGSDTYVTFRLGAMPGDPGSDVVRLLAHEFRAYGPLPCSARQLVHTLLQRAVASEQVGAVGSGSFAVELDGDSVLFRPLKLVLLHVFAQQGWKLPNLSRVVMGDLLCRPGGAVLRARSVDDNWTRDKSTGDGSQHLAAALAADEARSLFDRGDAAAYAGRHEEALRTYQSFQDRYGTHPGLVERLLDVLLLDPKPGHIVEAEALCRDLEARDPKSLVAAMGWARIADVLRNRGASVERWSRVSELLEARGESLDQAFCDLVVARHEGHADPDAAVQRLNAVLRTEPRNRAALEELRAIYERTRQYAELETTLKRLTGVARDKESQVETYVALARHLMGQQSQIAEARAFLERALRMAPNRFEILDALGETWVLSGDPARAVKTLGSAATSARQRGDLRTASQLLMRIGQLWEELGNREQALMQVRRALDLREEGGVHDPVGLAEQLRYAARLCEEDRQQSEAIAYWTEALAALQLAEARVDAPGVDRVEVRRALAETHRDIAAAYRARGRTDMAANHERRLIEMDPTDVDALDTMERHFRDSGGLTPLIDTLRDAVDRIGPNAESLALRTRLAERLHEVDRDDEAIVALEQALDIAPGAERVRRLLSTILIEAGQPDRLQFQLAALRDRVHQRDVQWAITIEMGEIALDALDDPEGAAMAFRDATLLLPARRDAYTRCRYVLERLAAQRGWHGRSPFGPGSIAEDLVALWQRAASSAPSHAERSSLRGELADMLTAMGEAAPDGALAWSLAQETLDEPPSGEIEMFEDSWSEAADADGDHDFDREVETRTVTRADAVLSDLRDDTQVPWAGREQVTANESETLEIGRASAEQREKTLETLELGRASAEQREEAFQTLELGRASNDERARVLQEVALHSAGDEESSFGELVARPDDEPAFPTVEDSNPRLVTDADSLSEGSEGLEFNPLADEPRPPSFSRLVSLDEAHRDEVEEFREQYEESTRRPPDLPDLNTIAPDSALARILQRSARRAPSADLPETAPPAEEVAPDTSFDEAAKTKKDRVLDLDALERGLSEARQEDSWDRIGTALESLLECEELSEARRLDLTFELAELLYYELEDGDRALDWLLEVRRLDPVGYGARPGVLNAIEAIYEERGSVDGQVEILRARLDTAHTDDLRNTYRLLLAQLEWERDAPDEARIWLAPVLENDDRHEGARRLLADMSEEAGEWEEVAEHLKIALSVAGDGLDSVELRKRLAMIYLDRLGEPHTALEHFQKVQQAAPQDAGAMEAVRRCQSALGDWSGVLKSLQEELRLLLGVTLPASEEDTEWLEDLSPDTVPGPLKVPASHVLADIARVMQDELDMPTEARDLWIQVAELWPDHLEAVERRIDLDQKLEHHGSKS